jgi:hypothetical protein
MRPLKRFAGESGDLPPSCGETSDSEGRGGLLLLVLLAATLSRIPTLHAPLHRSVPEEFFH